MHGRTDNHVTVIERRCGAGVQGIPKRESRQFVSDGRGRYVTCDAAWVVYVCQPAVAHSNAEAKGM